MNFNMNIVLYQPQIPQNTGNIARLCAATNTNLILIHPLGFRTDDRYLKRAGLDYWDKVNIYHFDSLDKFYEQFHNSRCFYASKSGKIPYTKVAFQENDSIIFGNETEGLPKLILEKHYDSTIKISMWGEVRCLNLSSSVAIILYEAYRQLGRF